VFISAAATGKAGFYEENHQRQHGSHQPGTANLDGGGNPISGLSTNAMNRRLWIEPLIETAIQPHGCGRRPSL